LLKELNDAQREAVLRCDVPLLILAGAGSGKTKVLCHKMMYLIKKLKIHPHDILAVTFTNKAASEMKERVYNLLKIPTWNLWVNTFHSACMKIMRAHAELIGYSKNFIIYDDSDQRKLLKKCLQELEMDPENFTPKKVQRTINRAKNNLRGFEEMQGQALSVYERKTAEVYRLYQETMIKNDAMDFGDIILNVVRLLKKYPEILKLYQEKFKYILVDEYQDTNMAQYTLLNMLAKEHNNICVVGDDDQSIYKFRGANIQNILNFEKDYKNAAVIKLEENYRSTKNILKAAHNVISQNRSRKGKELFTKNLEGEKIKCYNARDETAEAKYIIDEIKRFNDTSLSFKDIAIFFRTNAQSRVFEDEFFKEGIPYVIVRGTSFYSRAEIKDMLAYLKVVSGANDIVSIKRIINRPRRGIGNVTLEKVENYMNQSGADFFTALNYINDINMLSKNVKNKLELFSLLIRRLKEDAKTSGIGDLLKRIYEASGYKEMLEKDTSEENKDRINNINELIAGARQFEDESDGAGLSTYLDYVSLVNDTDGYDENKNRVALLTLHSAKGLEFPIVFITGMEEGIFPHARSIYDKEELEEERRLCYVGITRAKRHLILTHASSRRTYNTPSFQRPSRFLDDISEDIIIGRKKKSAYAVSHHRQGNFSGKFGGTKFQETPHGQKFQEHVVKTYFNDELKGSSYKVGKMYQHPVFGKGKLKKIEGGTGSEKLTLFFPKAGEKKILAKYVKLEVC
jgi:DNA helicase-2/ATP-dependent DNA helicase PcrA